jgi:hypothetical protein
MPHECMNGLVLVSNADAVEFVEVWRPCPEHNAKAYERWQQGQYQRDGVKRPVPEMPPDYQGTF